jgi:hypothetical protein
MMMMMIWTKVFTPKINNPLMQKQSPTFMQLEASNEITKPPDLKNSFLQTFHKKRIVNPTPKKRK